MTSKLILDVLSSNGHHDAALRLATQTAEPSWGFWWANNATTCWENWPGNGGFPDPDWKKGDSAGTRNHIFLCGGLVEWYWKHLVGLTPASPGFATVHLAPKVHPGLGPSSLDASYASVSGVIRSSWALKEEGTEVRLSVDLPVGVRAATVVVPKPFVAASSARRAAQAVVRDEANGGAVVWRGGRLVGSPDGIAEAVETADGVAFSVTPGRYAFVATTAAGSL